MTTKRDARETVDLLLDMLIDALEERKAERDPEIVPNGKVETPVVEPALTDALLEIEQAQPIEPEPEPELAVEEPIEPSAEIDANDDSEKLDEVAVEESAEFLSLDEPVMVLDSAETLDPIPQFEPLPEPLPSTGMDRTVKRMFIGIIFFVILANIPINYSQLNKWLGTSAVDGIQTVRVARDGMLIRAVNSNAVYIMEGNTRRWITTSEAFTDYGHRWGSIRDVSPAFVNEFAEGDPFYLLLKCSSSPHIYALDVQQKGHTTRVKRWIKDVPTLNSMKHQWQTIENVDCSWLRRLPQGTPFPADAGLPPQP